MPSSSSERRAASASGSKVITDPGQPGSDLLELLAQRLVVLLGHGAMVAAATGALRAVALLVLLAAPAPARVVPADVLAVGVHDLLRPGCHGAAARHRHRRRRRAGAGGGDRVGAGQRLVLVLEIAVRAVRRAGRLGERLLGLRRLQLRVEEREYDLAADLRAELLEHDVP